MHPPTATLPPAGAPARDDRATGTPTVDLVVPVHNEADGLAASIERLHAYLSERFPLTWRITIVDNASTDATAAVAAELAARLEGVAFVHLTRKGRGLALRAAWSASTSPVVAYTDVDLSTGLDALLPLVAPLVTGHSDVAIGSRLAAGANVARGPRREVISRIYNLILRLVFASRFRDAQCGFKALRTDVARQLLPEIRDDGWFFDTELLLLAEHNGMRIHEVPVDWVDDPDSRVDVTRTALDDLRGTARMARRFASGQGRVAPSAGQRQPFTDDRGRHLVAFGIVGSLSTLASLVLFLALAPVLGAPWAVVVALSATSVANAWGHRRWSMPDPTGPAYAGVAALVALGGIAASVAAVVGVDAAGGGVLADLGALALVWGAATAARFWLLGRAGRV